MMFLPTLIADVLIKATLLLLVVTVADRVLRQASSAVRHRIWGIAFVALLLLPIMSATVPLWRLAILPASWTAAFYQSDPGVVGSETAIAKIVRSEATLPLPSNVRAGMVESQASRSAKDASTVLSLTPVEQSIEIPQASSPLQDLVLPPESKERQSSVSAWGWLVLIWSIGCMISLGPLVIGIYRNAMLKLASKRVSDSNSATLVAQLCKLLNIRRKVYLIECDQELIPMTWGVVKPTVILPRTWRDWLEECQRLVLLHELAHVKRLDVLYQLIARLTCVLYWFHPLVWYALRRLRIEREIACDDCVLMAGQRPSSYAQQLLNIARDYHAMALPPTVAMVQRAGLEYRVRALLDKARSHSPVTPRIGSALLAGGLLFALVLAAIRLEAIAAAGNEQAPIPALKELKKLRVRVVDEAGQPVSGARVYSSTWSKHAEDNKKPNVERFTDDTGWCEVELYPQLYILRIWCGKRNHVTLFANWEEGETHRIPDEYVFTLQKGTVLGGTVTDPDGHPVADARIEVRLNGGGIKVDSGSRTRLDVWLAEGKDAAVTDATGKWNISNAPDGDDLELELNVHHPNYCCGRNWQPIGKFGLDLAALRAGTAAIRLNRGVIVTGKVQDPEGKPVEGALIVWGDQPNLAYASQETKTGPNGEFRLPALSTGRVQLTLFAKGWMPQMQMVDVKEDMDPAAFSVQPGKQLQVKVVDASGQPVPDADFALQSWRGVSVESVADEIQQSGVPGRANDQGIYNWDWAPDDAVTFLISRVVDSECIANKTVEFTADETEQIVSLPANFVLSGTIVNAATGEAVPECTITPITCDSRLANFRGLAQRSSSKTVKSGSFSVNAHVWDRVVENAFQFEAPGFRVFTTPRFDVHGPAQSIEVRLEPTVTLKGRVLGTDGRPTSRARIGIAIPKDGLIISDEESYRSSHGLRQETDAEGVFEYPTHVEPFVVVAATDDGYAEKYCQPGEAAGDLQLRPWARVEGAVYQDGRPVPDALVILRPIRQLGGDNPHLQDSFQFRTEANGRFVFGKVPPVPSTVSAHLSSWDDFPMTSGQVLPLDLQPGEKRQVKLGGDGLQVVGRVKLNGNLADRIEFRYGIHTLVRTDGGQIDVPKHARNGIEWMAGEQREYQQKLAGGSDLKGMEQHTVKLNPDGTFLINGVRPGSYRFLLQVYEPPSGCLVDPVGYGFLEFRTSDYPVTDNCLDLGTIVIELKEAPQAGEVLPDFSWQTTDGQRQFLSQFRGRHVLLDCWATWCGPCVAAMPDVARVQRELGGPNLEVISLNIDADVEAARELVATKGMTWTQGFIGDQTPSVAGQMLGISSVPLYVVLDPDRKVLVRSANFEDVEKVLTGALEGKP